MATGRAERRRAERLARRAGGHLVAVHPDGSVEVCFGGPGDGCTDRMRPGAGDGVASTGAAGRAAGLGATERAWDGLAGVRGQD